MFFISAGYDIREKISALNGDNTQSFSFLEILNWTVVGLLIIAIAYLLTRGLFREGKRERRGIDKKKDGDVANAGSSNLLQVDRYMSNDVDTVEDDGAEVTCALCEIDPGVHLALFWNVGELRCGCLGQAESSSNANLVVGFDSESTPTKGRALLAVPEAIGHVSFYEVNVVEAQAGNKRILGMATIRAASRMNRRFRTHVAVPTAIMKKNGEDADDSTMMARIHDMALDGLGVLSEEPLHEDDELVLRLQLPGYLEPLTLEGRVAWSQEDVAGIFRAGVELSLDAIETRLNLADFMLGRLKAESSAIVLDQRRRDNTPMKPTPIENP